MYRDNSLIPLEAIRIAGLGALSVRPLRYAEIAADIRRFSSRIVGPSLDLMGSSVEILRTEGLIGRDRAINTAPTSREATLATVSCTDAPLSRPPAIHTTRG